MLVQHGPATSFSAATACIVGQFIRVVGAFPGELIVVPQFVAWFDIPNRFDEHAAAFDHRFAIGSAAVVDVAGFVAVDAGVDHRPIAGDEQEGVAVVLPFLIVAPIRLRVRHAFAQVLDDARALLDRRNGFDASAVNRRIVDGDQRGGGRNGSGSFLSTGHDRWYALNENWN